MATIAAEFSRGGLPLFGGLAVQLRDGDFLIRQETLKALRRLSGELTLYRFDMQNGLRDSNEAEAGRFESWNEALARGEALPEIISLLRDEALLLRLARRDPDSDKAEFGEAAAQGRGQILDT